MRFFAVALIFFGVAASYAQTPLVPHKMKFADMSLSIRDDARREIQADVDALMKSPKYFSIKVERARTYFPIIEKIFAEERLPEDFKYLSLQESALIADAVSVSNAVGFWQFKDFTAIEMGLRVDQVIDERKNIVSASRGAARYLKQNNFMFNNWILALQAYQMGAGGVQRAVGDQYNGARHMEITSETYWYVKKFLAHKIAFEEAVEEEPQLKVQIVNLKEEKSVSDLARQMAIEEADLLLYNKWIRNGKIPGDKTYAVVVPGSKVTPEIIVTKPAANPAVATTSETSTEKIVINEKATVAIDEREINGIKAVRGIAGETPSQMASRIGIDLENFLKYNDISIDHRINPDVYYFKNRKKGKTSAERHIITNQQDLWMVSQMYGISLKKLMRLNSITDPDQLKAGDELTLIARKGVPSVYTVALEETVQISTNDFFNWEVNPGAETKMITEPKAPEQVNEQKLQVIEVNEPTEKLNSERQIEIDLTSSSSPKQDSTVMLEVKNAVSSDENSLPVTENILQESMPGLGIHKVAQGETLYSIAKKYNVEVIDLLNWNGLNQNSGIKTGQQLIVVEPLTPGNEVQELKSVSKDAILHEVKPADTLYSVARQYNVSIKEIMDWNQKGDFSLTLGEKLKIFPR